MHGAAEDPGALLSARRAKKPEPPKRGKGGRPRKPPEPITLTQVERLAIRLGRREPAEAAALEGLTGHPGLPDALALAQSPAFEAARGGDRTYATRLISEARLLMLVRLRDAYLPGGVLPQAMTGLEKTAEAIGEERPRTELHYHRVVRVAAEKEEP